MQANIVLVCKPLAYFGSPHVYPILWGGFQRLLFKKFQLQGAPVAPPPRHGNSTNVVRMMYNQELRTATLIKVPISHLTSHMISCFCLNNFKTYSYRTKFVIRKLNGTFPVADQGWRPLQTNFFSISSCIFLQKMVKYWGRIPQPPPPPGSSRGILNFP